MVDGMERSAEQPGGKEKEQECKPMEMDGQATPPSAMVIFGASGDLTRRKLIPALYNLETYKILSKQFFLVGIARRPMSNEAFRQWLKEGLALFDCPVDGRVWEAFSRHLYYLAGDLNDPGTYERLKGMLAQGEKEHGRVQNTLFYLSIMPDFFAEVIRRLDTAGLAKETDSLRRRVIIEKPFGHDLASARTLNQEIRKILTERQIYRIDHYLGKETVQNIMAFRFANGFFEPIWNRQYIDHVQISAAETVGVEHRAGYYEGAGALRDMIPNHLFQLLTLTAMECPVSFDADAVRDEQAKVIHGIQPLTNDSVLAQTVRGQYGEGVLSGQRVPAYRAEEGVAPDSRTETYAALRLMIDNWRWADVPFYLRTGKRLARRFTEIAIQFRRPPFMLFRRTAVGELQPNRLVLNIQPDEGISLSFQAKVPGGFMKLGTVDMDFEYADYFGETQTTGYERLVYDAMCGDATLYQRADMVEASWKVIGPIQDMWAAVPPPNFPNYAAGSWGPEEADQLVSATGGWHRPESGAIPSARAPVEKTAS
jgi:glucose-6-phosphate 1-dehydrogenase